MAGGFRRCSARPRSVYPRLSASREARGPPRGDADLNFQFIRADVTFCNRHISERPEPSKSVISLDLFKGESCFTQETFDFARTARLVNLPICTQA